MGLRRDRIEMPVDVEIMPEYFIIFITMVVKGGLTFDWFKYVSNDSQNNSLSPG